jgi:hypothetical protein
MLSYCPIYALAHGCISPEFLNCRHHPVIVCAILGVGNVYQTVAKVLSSPELLELGLVPKACPHLFLISRLPVRILLFLEIHLSPDVAAAEGFDKLLNYKVKKRLSKNLISKTPKRNHLPSKFSYKIGEKRGFGRPYRIKARTFSKTYALP